MKKLYMFYLGGGATGANLELHDVQFAIVEQVAEAYSELKQAWIGDKNKLHLDGYTWINWADGYDVELRSEAPSSKLRLFFVNVGGYQKGHLAELHAFDFFVAETAQQAKQKALRTLLNNVTLRHKDNLKQVEHCLKLDLFENHYIHLIPNAQGVKPLPEWQGYRPI